MSTLVRAIPVRYWVEQLPLMTASLLIAETFYEFHSFILEAWAFFATWYALDAVLVAWRDRKRR